MSDKKDKGYDPALLRAVGNILAGTKDYLARDIYTRHKLIDAAIMDVTVVRARLQAIQKKESD